MKPNTPKVSPEMVKANIAYDPDTGELTSLTTRNSIRVGEVCGTVGPDGYIRLGLLGERFLAHRVAWLLMTGHWPTSLVDHKDRNRSNNTWDNLRLATPSDNCRNAKVSKNNTSGCTGVVYRKHLSRWQATIRLNGERVSLGHFAEYQDAAAARRRAERMHFGEFLPVKVASESEAA